MVAPGAVKLWAVAKITDRVRGLRTRLRIQREVDQDSTMFFFRKMQAEVLQRQRDVICGRRDL